MDILLLLIPISIVLIAIVVTGVIAAGLLFLAYQRLNLPPEARARKAIEKAEVAEAKAANQVLPQDLRRELGQASDQLEAARTSYLNESFSEAESDAESARLRFLALAGSGTHQLAGVGEFFSLEGRIQLQRAGQGQAPGGGGCRNVRRIRQSDADRRQPLVLIGEIDAGDRKSVV